MNGGEKAGIGRINGETRRRSRESKEKRVSFVKRGKVGWGRGWNGELVGREIRGAGAWRRWG